MPNIRAIYLDEPNDAPQAAPKKSSIRAMYLDEPRQEQKEGLGAAAVKAPFRVLEDAMKGGYNFATKIPEYYEQAKTEVPGLLDTATKHPGHLAMQGLAGANEMINKLAQAPKGLAEYGANRLNLLPQSVPNAISKVTPEDTTQSINQLFDQPQYPGEAMTRGALRNLPEILTTKGIASTLNPMKLTTKNIAKNIVRTEQKMKDKYSGPTGEYENLSKEARQRGITQDHIDPKKIDLDTIKKYTSEKNYASLDNFLANKNLSNAQKAISDLGYMERRLDNKVNLNSEEKAQLKAVKDAKQYIQGNMFKDKSGNIHQDLLEKHKKIQEGYATEVVPYTKNAAIQKYKKGKKLADELVTSLSKGEFAAMRGKHHPAIGIRKLFGKHGVTAGVSGALGASLYGLLSGKSGGE